MMFVSSPVVFFASFDESLCVVEKFLETVTFVLVFPVVIWYLFIGLKMDP